MTWNKSRTTNHNANDGWGGPWTEKKLNAFSKYVRSYITIMKKNPFWETIYFDGFAGSGTKSKDDQNELYEQLKITWYEESTYKGAAERVIELHENFSFNYYYFIDKDEESLQKLKELLEVNAGYDEKRIKFKSGDANEWILELSKALKTRKYASLVFLDPFGMQINWESIESLKGTRSDVWILIPTGVIVNRLLDRAGELKNIGKLVSFLGFQKKKLKAVFTGWRNQIHCLVKKK